MPEIPILANGSKVEYTTTATTYVGATDEDYTRITGLTDLKSPSTGEAEDQELNDLDSDDAFKEFVAGLADAGMLEFTFKYTKAKLSSVAAIFRARKGWRVTFPDGSTICFDGHLKKADPVTESGKPMTVACGVKVSGAPLFTPAA